MKLPELPHLRELDRNDEQECNLVLAGWLRTYVDQSHGVERSVFFRLCQPVVKGLLARSNVVVATLPEAHDVVLGWVCFDAEQLHFCCCKPRWQRLGIASYLLRDFYEHSVQYTHRTKDGDRLLERLAPKDWQYAPMLRFQEAA